MGRRWPVVLVGAGVLVVAAVGVGSHFYDQVSPYLHSERCTAEIDGESVALTPEQAGNAGLIGAIAVRRGLPARAVTIAVATSMQESKLYNLESGDRDSLGLFQQRPSQGWGTPREILDPYYSINTFYDALEEVDGYDSMEITEAAQEVQRSGYPEAYAEHEPDARVLASALTGYSPHVFSCTLDGDVQPAADKLRPSGLTPRADLVRRDLEAAFGPLSLGGFAPGGVSSGHMEGSAHYDGRALDVFVRPVSEENNRRGWAIASYLVSQADRLGIQNVIFDARIWTSGSRSDDGWRDYDPPSEQGDRAVLEHRDHVHVDVFE